MTEITEVRANIGSSVSELIEDLASEELLQRRQAAYTIEYLGPAAISALGPLIAACRSEKNQINRAFMVRAIAAIDDSTPETLGFLRLLFHDSQNKILRTYLAGAILKLTELHQSEVELQYLLDSVNPKGSENELIDEISRNEFWEQRWAAAYMIAKLQKKAISFIPALEQISEAADVPGWVRKEFWFTLSKISHFE